jgi:CHRD domain
MNVLARFLPCAMLPCALLAAVCCICAPAYARDDDDDTFAIRLRSFEEVPAVSSAASGRFRARINETAGTITYELSYAGLQGDIRQAHIHFGQRGVNGGISVFLCQTTTNPDPTGGAPTCSASPATVTGTLTAANVIGPAGQGIAATEFAELVRAIRAGVAYVNVHTSQFPAGEIRGQARGSGHGHDRH